METPQPEQDPNAVGILYVYDEKYSSSVNQLKNFRENQGYYVETYKVTQNDT